MGRPAFRLEQLHAKAQALITAADDIAQRHRDELAKIADRSFLSDEGKAAQRAETVATAAALLEQRRTELARILDDEIPAEIAWVRADRLSSADPVLVADARQRVRMLLDRGLDSQTIATRAEHMGDTATLEALLVEGRWLVPPDVDTTAWQQNVRAAIMRTIGDPDVREFEALALRVEAEAPALAHAMAIAPKRVDETMTMQDAIEGRIREQEATSRVASFDQPAPTSLTDALSTPAEPATATEGATA